MFANFAVHQHTCRSNKTVQAVLGLAYFQLCGHTRAKTTIDLGQNSMSKEGVLQ